MITGAIVGALVSLLVAIIAPPVLRGVARVCHYAADAIKPNGESGTKVKLLARKSNRK